MILLLKLAVLWEFVLATSFIGDSKNCFKCRFCKVCLGRVCIGEMPGMGGVNNSENFLLNCSGWDNISFPSGQFFNSVSADNLGIAPVTGANQNIGFSNESDFYFPYFLAAYNKGIAVCVGDGAPDEKLKLGLSAVQKIGTKAYFFLKPYPNERLFERIDWICNSACAIGIDIDAYNIVSMRNQAKLEKKTEAQLKEFRKYSKLPLIIKGVFTEEDVELCKVVKPEIIVVSNHGGRVQTESGSTADFLQKNAAILKSCCSELWVDGGIRKKRDIQVAMQLGATKCLAARPFIARLCEGIAKNAENGELAGIRSMENEIQKMLN